MDRIHSICLKNFVTLLKVLTVKAQNITFYNRSPVFDIIMKPKIRLEKPNWVEHSFM